MPEFADQRNDIGGIEQIVAVEEHDERNQNREAQMEFPDTCLREFFAHIDERSQECLR